MINKNFTLLWTGKIVSQLGDEFYAIALAWWILQKTNSPSIMGFFLLTSVLPGILLGLFAGVFADRWKRKTILIITDLIRSGLVLVISLLALNNALEIWHVFVIAFFLSCAAAFFDPAIQAVIPQIVEKDSLSKANGLSQAVGGVTTVAGPLFGAVAVSVFGLVWVFTVNSISYFISAVLTLFISVKEFAGSNDEKKHIWNDLKEGLKFLKKQQNVMIIMEVIAVAHFFLGSLLVAIPFLAKGLPGDGIKNLGYLEMMMGVGLIAGSVFISARKKVPVDEEKLIRIMLIVGVCFTGISVLQILGIKHMYAYLGLMTVIGVCIAFASVFWQSLLQSYTPDYMAGRIFSISSLLGNLSLPVAYGIFGILLGISSIKVVMGVCGVMLIIICFKLYGQRINKRAANIA